MKKKFLNFILAICLVFPCVFALSACNTPPNTESWQASLAGKTIIVDSPGDISWNQYGISNTHLDGDRGAFSIDLTLEQFVERYWQTEVISDIIGNNDYSSLTQAKQAFTDAVKVKIATYSPKITISEDETTAVVEYDYPGCSNPIKNCTVVKGQIDPYSTSYKLFYGGISIGSISYMNGGGAGLIECSTSTHSDYLFIYDLNIDLSKYTSIPMDLVAVDGSGDICHWTLSQSNHLSIATGISQKYKLETK